MTAANQTAETETELTYAWVFKVRSVTCQAHKLGCQAVPAAPTRTAVPMGTMTLRAAKEDNEPV